MEGDFSIVIKQTKAYMLRFLKDYLFNEGDY